MNFEVECPVAEAAGRYTSIFIICMKNPYTVKFKKATLLKSVVCFADILGFSQLSTSALEHGNGNDFLRDLRNALTKTYTRVKKHSEGIGGEAFFAYKVFTDNIVVGYPLYDPDHDHGEPESGHILEVFIELQLALVLEGYLVRGGLAFGNHYMDNDIVFGNALIEATTLDKSGGPPRISLSRSAIKLIEKQLGFYANKEGSPHYRFLLRDFDGKIFLNYLSEAFIGFPDDGIYFDVFEKHKNVIMQGLKDNGNNSRVRSKYEWVARYHNFICQEFIDSHPITSDLDIDDIYFTACTEAQKLHDYIIDNIEVSEYPTRL